MTRRNAAQWAATRCYATETRSQPVRSTTRSLDLQGMHRRIHDLFALAVRIENDILPTEARVMYVFEQFEGMAKAILDERQPNPNGHATAPRPILKPDRPKSPQYTNKKAPNAASALLGSVNATQYPAQVSKAGILDLISEKAEEIVRHPDVFITPDILRLYVELQARLGHASSFADVFNLYAHKPAPTLKSNHDVTYSAVSPDKINAAIDPKTANLALTAAIDSHNLPLAIDVITTSFCTLAFKKSKVFRQAAVPIAGLVIAPFTAYGLATSFSSWQNTMDPAMATQIAFAGIMTYTGAVGMVGYVAVTTANDQMDRVTWAPGVPLWERWIREEERAAVDRVAGAWGFKEVDKRGDEEGEDWEALREWVGVRGMVLDRVSLMQGME